MKISVGNPGIVVLALMMMMLISNGETQGTREIGVGVILDMDSHVGKSIRISILMAIKDFYRDTNHSTTIIAPHFRDSKHDNVEASSAVIDLLKNTQVMAIIGPQKSSQAAFVIDIAQRSKVPMISPATNPDLSPIRNPYFIRIAQASSTQAQPIAALVKSFGWREVVFVYEDTDFGRGPIPYLLDAMVNISTQVKYRSLLSPSFSDDKILQELYKLKTMQTRVFVVHMLPDLASRFFKKADEAGMMAQGYAWIITDVLTDLLNQLDPEAIDSMQGVLGVKPYIPPSNQLTKFEKRWKRRFHKEYPDDIDRIELDMFGIWSYDYVVGLAIALKSIDQIKLSTTFKRPRKSSTDLAAIGTSEMGPTFLPLIRDIRLKGMISGDFQVVNGQLQTSAYQIVNVIGKGEKPIGFWSSRNGISNRIINNGSSDYTTNKDNLGAIIWPGDTSEFPKGWEIATGGDKILRVGIPTKGGFIEFVQTSIDPKTKEVNASGFCVDIFKAVIDALPFDVRYKFIPYENPNGEPIGDYNDLVYQIFLEKFDMVVGDLTILWNRSNYVEFTLPYSESGVSMLVPNKVDDSKNMWIFMRPLEMELWITIGGFFIYIGFVVWVLEHRVNKEFRGPPHQQVGMIFWFSFSTLVFAHKEKMMSNLSKFVVIVWIFVVLVLTSSYTASLASMLTVQKLRPTLTSIYELKARGDYVGYQDGSFVVDMLKKMGFHDDKLKKYTNIQEYANALLNGTTKNGVSAIVDEVPYLKMLQAKNCNKYVMVGPTYKTAGFGFAFPKGSPLVNEFSRAILKVREEQMRDISDNWIRDEADCPGKNVDVEPFEKLTLESFKGLFIVAGLSSTCALVIFFFMFLYENKEILVSDDSTRHKWTTIIQNFDKKKGLITSETKTVDDSNEYIEDNMINYPPMSPAISDYHQSEGVFSPASSTYQ
ncbi:glutamate receptor 2.7 isoform X1 [Lactuca sativa]|uniref:Glutamate receptor n=1 Tax=Lactuca sativa TaxID=4236 RepID=A0A9R1V5T7_LACSA|nr:glutamate receptor 2.7 isoform X1 [Lactuca sativa]KAJ0198803.1 hypothetical protein LSAT_V11C600335940 [Lactuca sativa]